MEPAHETLNPLSITLDPGEVLKLAGFKEKVEREVVETLLRVVRPLILPRAIYKASFVEAREEDSFVTEGFRFTGRVLAGHLEKAGRVFPYVVTIGPGLEETARATRDLSEKYLLDTIGTVAVGETRRGLEQILKSRFALPGLSTIGPGQLKDWPLEEQRVLFSLLGDVEGSIGVRLEENLLMRPLKSLSGIYFPTETTFYTCRLCPRENCPLRKAPCERGSAGQQDV